jgi:predicted small secreted protein
MDKVKLSSRLGFFGIILAVALLAGGCETAKGFASGVGSTVEGAGKDIYNAWGFLKSADSWVDKNVW